MSDISGASVETGVAAIRRDRRPDPRLGTAAAGAGCALAVLGVLTVSFDALDGDSGGGGSQAPGTILSLLVLAAGLALLARGPGDAFHTAGSVAATLSIPPLLFFLTFDEGSFPPYSTEAILGVSTAAWIALHVVGPAAGRTFPLGAGLIAAWLFVLQIIEEPFTSPFDLFSVVVETGFESDDADFTFGRGFDAPDLATMGFISLLFGIAMLVAASRFDRRGQRGRATAFAAAAIVMLPVGVLLLADDLEWTGAGLLGVVVGTGLAAAGALTARRGTTWAGGALILVSAGAVVGDLFDSATSFGVAAAVAGAGLVVGAHAAAAALGEPPELIPGPSTFTRGVRITPPSPTEF